MKILFEECCLFDKKKKKKIKKDSTNIYLELFVPWLSYIIFILYLSNNENPIIISFVVIRTCNVSY